MREPLIETVGLTKYFQTPKGQLHAVEDVNLCIYRGETLGVVGESGCGKTTLGRTIMRLVDASSGQIKTEYIMICRWCSRIHTRR